MHRSAKVLALCLMLGVTALLGACNTVSGAGEDVSAAGRAVTNSAERLRP
ncbi:entericidin A/B family lipoprotein [Roseomonas sp. NAR14]|uniref:Entericidin A/B family lipoprotein n=1 Tax=Roseomonas acroporae TaxID=2937791 RepID=A0A9X2BS77_9PROT|nr:entericidin A/B family lipoprotein [Roseomonas acroporae]MCK8782832.1 entericidin A/B family lipoprotein [Roseomonas acroporae]